MKKAAILISTLLLFFSLSVYASPEGYLFVIGGGHRPPEMMKEFVRLAGKVNSGKIVVFPMASSVPDEVGPEQAQELRSLGAEEVECHILSRNQALNKENAHILNDVGGVFFSGGAQSRLADVIRDTSIHRKLLEIYRRGAVIGGTSAGAAVLSQMMITGDEKRREEDETKFSTIESNNVVTEPGFGLIKSVIVDQHFIARKRHNRLISLVLEYPQILGLGIDESTAILVKPDQTFEVMGKSNAIIYDATEAHREILPSHKISCHGVVMHILKAGDRFNLKTQKVLKK